MVRAILCLLALGAAIPAAAAAAEEPAVDTATLASIMGKIDSYYFMQLERHPVFPRKQVELGARLFSDPRLSRDGSLSCATCHRRDKAFTDGRARAVGREGRVLRRNTPGLAGVLNYERFFWDGRAATLDDAIRMALGNPDEMNQDLPTLERRLARYPEYRSGFSGAFGAKTIRGGDIIAALRAYTSVISFPKESAFDRFREDRGILSNAEQRGLLLFYGKARCVKCHFGPAFSDQGFHDIGLRDQTSDPGRFAVDGQTTSIRAFRTPSLREVAATPPYMHDGSLKTLRDVVDFYDRGGDAHEGQDPLIHPLRLSSSEKGDLVAFLSSLSSNAPSDPGEERAAAGTERRACSAGNGASEADFREAGRVSGRAFDDIWEYYAYKAFARRDPSVCDQVVATGSFLGRAQTASFMCREWYNEMLLAYHATIGLDVAQACFPAMNFNYHLPAPDARAACQIFADPSRPLEERCSRLVPRYLSRENRASCVDWLKQFSLDEEGCRKVYGYGGSHSLLDRCVSYALFRRAKAAADPGVCRRGRGGGKLCLLFMGRREEVAAGQLKELSEALCGGPTDALELSRVR